MNKKTITGIALVLILLALGATISATAQTLLPDRKESLESQLTYSAKSINKITSIRDSLHQQVSELNEQINREKSNHKTLRCELAHLKLADAEDVTEETKEICLGK